MMLEVDNGYGGLQSSRWDKQDEDGGQQMLQNSWKQMISICIVYNVYRKKLLFI